MSLLANILTRGFYSDPEGDIGHMPADRVTPVAVNCDAIAAAVAEQGFTAVEDPFLAQIEHLPLRPAFDLAFFEWTWPRVIGRPRHGAFVFPDPGGDAVMCMMFADDARYPAFLGQAKIEPPESDDAVAMITSSLTPAGEDVVAMLARQQPDIYDDLEHEQQRAARAMTFWFGMGTISAALRMMHVKNIALEDAPLRKKAKKQKRPRPDDLIDWRTLVVTPRGRADGAAGTPLAEALTAQHLVRGHFKTYTAERPLFGRLVGTFWVAPHVRGSDEVGVVQKGYELRPPSA